MIRFKVRENNIDVYDEYSGIETNIGFNFASSFITVAQTEAFLDSLVKHITYVREAGEKIGVARHQLEWHDLSKFSVLELPGYVRNFFGDKADPDGFASAWLNHIHQNNHHWQHYIFPDGHTPKGSTVENGVVFMPYHYALEMVADWIGASKAYTGSEDMTDWLVKNLPNIRVHSKTKEYLRQELDMLGYADVVNGGW
jgi:hypothetical protein